MPRTVANQIEDQRLTPQVPTFSGADDSRYTTSEWLQTVERFATQFRWRGYQTLRYAAGRLTGAAKLWHERAGETHLNFEECKTALIRSIPERSYSWEQKQEILTRRQKFEETVEEYILDKEALCTRFGLSMTDAIEFLLGGLKDRDIYRSMAGHRYGTIAKFISSAQEIGRVLAAGPKFSNNKESRPPKEQISATNA